jgi:hypothetical protein
MMGLGETYFLRLFLQTLFQAIPLRVRMPKTSAAMHNNQVSQIGSLDFLGNTVYLLRPRRKLIFFVGYH